MKTIFKNVDCISMYVDDLDKGLTFYQKVLGLKLLWRTNNSCGLGLDNDITEVVLVTEHNPMVDFLVESVIDIIPYLINNGCSITYGPFDIDIGKCAVVKDPWDNTYCILDMTKGHYTTGENKIVNGVKK